MVTRTSRRSESKEEEALPTPPAPVETDEVNENAIDIVVGDHYIRQYSQAVHGDNFMDLAREFCTKKPSVGGKGSEYKMVPVHEIKEVEVRYREKEDAEKKLDEQKPDSPMVDKVRKFGDKDEALAFRNSKTGASVVVSKKK